MRQFAGGATVLRGTVFYGKARYETGGQAREGGDPGAGEAKPSPGLAAGRHRR